MAATSASEKNAISGLQEQPKTPCPHTLDFPVQEKKELGKASLACCADCELTENLWLCLVCGSLGCGRDQSAYIPDAPPGNGHAEAHALSTGHGVCVKMGTITPEGEADVHCYSCDKSADFNYGEVIDPELPKHLAALGIDVTTQEKTVGSLDELSLRSSMAFDFGAVAADGSDLVRRYGAGFTGIRNLGNTCYMNSILQVMLSLPAMRQRYLVEGAAHVRDCALADPSSCFHCQAAKLADGVLSGRYSVEDAEERLPAPSTFKALVGDGHPDFAGSKQQDAEEYLHHLVKVIERAERSAAGRGDGGSGDPTNALKFSIERRIQCPRCSRVGYSTEDRLDLSLAVPLTPRALTEEEAKDAEKAKDADVKGEPVSLDDCLATFLTEDLAKTRCTACDEVLDFNSRLRIATFPDTLVLHMRRFGFFGDGWVPKKLDVDVDVPTEIDLASMAASGPADGEELLPEAAGGGGGGDAAPAWNADMLAQMVMFGFPEVQCQNALIAVDNASPDAAMGWLMDHMDDPDINTPPAAPGGGAGGAAGGGGAGAGPAVPDDLVDLVEGMGLGFPRDKVAYALSQTDLDPNRAIDWLFSHGADPLPVAADDDGGDAAVVPEAVVDERPPKYKLHGFVAHRGTSIHCGHYVAFLRSDDGEWTLYDDSRVSTYPAPPLSQGYLYVYRKSS
eukprot:PLAT3552.2.p1 GENE.PLAT3552.2~~PLAT3552.2.p1  ORF type:complete len:677 (-),score=325.93 PLAT3552.2:156-2186(-)